MEKQTENFSQTKAMKELNGKRSRSKHDRRALRQAKRSFV